MNVQSSTNPGVPSVVAEPLIDDEDLGRLVAGMIPSYTCQYCTMITCRPACPFGGD